MLLLVVSALLATAEPAALAPAQSQASPQAPAVKPKRICRMEEAVTGSLTPKRVCVTLPQPQAAPAPKPDENAARENQPQKSAAGGSND
jgi:hypothetical protein